MEANETGKKSDIQQILDEKLDGFEEDSYFVEYQSN